MPGWSPAGTGRGLVGAVGEEPECGRIRRGPGRLEPATGGSQQVTVELALENSNALTNASGRKPLVAANLSAAAGMVHFVRKYAHDGTLCVP